MYQRKTNRPYKDRAYKPSAPQIIEALEVYSTMAAVAKRFGISRQTCYNILTREGYQVTRKIAPA